MKLAELAPQVDTNEVDRVGSPGRQKCSWQSCLPRKAKMKLAELAPQVGKNEVGRVGFQATQK